MLSSHGDSYQLHQMTVYHTFVLLSVLLIQVSCSGEFQLRFTTIHNAQYTELVSSPTDSNMHSLPRINPCPAGPCRTFLRICLSHYQAVLPASPVCTYGLMSTPVLDFTDDTLMYLHPPQLVQFPFKFTWPGSFSLIVEAWHDLTNNTPTQGSQRSLIWRLAIQRHLHVNTTWTNIIHQSALGLTLAVMEYRVICDVSYHGTGCIDRCVPRDDMFGHYSCMDGHRICHLGWTGDYCQKPVCSEGCQGFCSKPFECRCRVGWQGVNCDECVSYPGCLNGFCVQPWQCLCRDGWGGIYCHHDLNYCTTHSPCRNNATCLNAGDGGYTCHCPAGFTGTNCEVDVRDCSHQLPCLNSGTCIFDATVQQYSCHCPVGFVGVRCEWPTVSVTSAECHCVNGGICSSTRGRQHCMCPPGYTGVYCEINVDECVSSPCLNGGRCIDAIDSYHCNCPSMFTGPQCNNNIDDCERLNNPCLNGATCTDSMDSFHCTCPPGYTGTICQFHTPTNISGTPPAVSSNGSAPSSSGCHSSPCIDKQSVCVDLNEGQFQCVPCTNCSTIDTGSGAKDNCARSPCSNGATCMHLSTEQRGYICHCLPFYYGIHCQLRQQTTTSGMLLNNTSTAISDLFTSLAEQHGGNPQHQLVITVALIIALVVVLLLAVALVGCAWRRHCCRGDSDVMTGWIHNNVMNNTSNTSQVAAPLLDGQKTNVDHQQHETTRKSVRLKESNLSENARCNSNNVYLL